MLGVYAPAPGACAFPTPLPMPRGDSRTMNPLDTVGGTIIAGFVLAIIIAVIL